MVDPRAIGGAISYFLVGALWGYVGLRLMARPARGEDRTALRAFATFWLGLAAHSSLGTTFALLLVFGVTTGPLIVAGTFAAAVVIPVTFWGLLYYLAYLYLGRSSWLRPLTALYAAQTMALVGVVAYLRPISIESHGWIPLIRYAHDAGAALDSFITLVFVIPALVGSAAYVALFFKVRTRTQRFRVGMVGGGIFLWIATSIAIGAIPGDRDVAHVASRLVSFAAAIGVIVAYDPPAWVRARLRVHGLEQEVARPLRDIHLEAARRAALLERTRELV